tara:strand:- start:17 stop:490 length:474 start_codon:yes stop_codon:yes gene_type:complete
VGEEVPATTTAMMVVQVEEVAGVEMVVLLLKEIRLEHLDLAMLGELVKTLPLVNVVVEEAVLVPLEVTETHKTMVELVVLAKQTIIVQVQMQHMQEAVEEVLIILGQEALEVLVEVVLVLVTLIRLVVMVQTILVAVVAVVAVPQAVVREALVAQAS